LLVVNVGGHIELAVVVEVTRDEARENASDGGDNWGLKGAIPVAEQDAEATVALLEKVQLAVVVEVAGLQISEWRAVLDDTCDLDRFESAITASKTDSDSPRPWNRDVELPVTIEVANDPGCRLTTCGQRDRVFEPAVPHSQRCDAAGLKGADFERIQFAVAIKAAS
jgi:hypothetical protein